MASRAFLGTEIRTFGCLDLNVGGTPYRTNSAIFLRVQHNPLQLEMAVERMDRPVAPNEVVFLDGRQVFRPFGKAPGDGVQCEARMKCRNERDINRETRRIFDLRYLESIDLLPLFLGIQVDLPHALPVLRALQDGFEAGETASRQRAVAKHFAADPASKDTSDDERYFAADAEFVDLVAGRFVVRGEDDDITPGDELLDVWEGHDVGFDRVDFRVGFPVPQKFGERVNLFFSTKATSGQAPGDM